MSVGYQEFLARKRREVERNGIEVAADDLHRGLAIELKRSYWEESVRVMEDLDFQRSVPTLFDGGGAA